MIVQRSCFVFDRFYPSKAKAIADKIIADELTGVKYDEEDAKVNSMNISDKVREAVNGKFTQVFFIVRILNFTFAESLGKSRYKIVVQTTMGQVRDQGIRVASRCLWDPVTDNYASCSFANVSITLVVMVFLL